MTGSFLQLCKCKTGSCVRVWDEDFAIYAHADVILRAQFLEKICKTLKKICKRSLSSASIVSQTLDIHGTARHQHKLAYLMMLMC